MTDTLKSTCQDLSLYSSTLLNQSNDLQEKSFKFQSEIQAADYPLKIKSEILRKFTELYTLLIAVSSTSQNFIELNTRFELLTGFVDVSRLNPRTLSSTVSVPYSDRLRQFGEEVKTLSYGYSSSIDELSKLAIQIRELSKPEPCSIENQKKIQKLSVQLIEQLSLEQGSAASLQKLSETFLEANLEGK